MLYNTHTHTPDVQPGITALYNQFPHEDFQAQGPFSTGIHPWHIDANTWRSHLEQVATWLQHPQALALGECGLDNRRPIDMKLQIDVFEAQLELAKNCQKPVVLHLVDAWDALLASVKKVKPHVPLLVHGFSKSQGLAQQLLQQGFYLSFGKYLMQNPELGAIFAEVPVGRYLLETDMSPWPLAEVYARAAACRGSSVAQVTDEVAATWEQIFHT